MKIVSILFWGTMLFNTATAQRGGLQLLTPTSVSPPPEGDIPFVREDYLGLEGLQAVEASAAAQVLLNAHGFLSFEFGQYRVLQGNESFEQNYSSMIAGRIHSQYNTADAYLVFIPSLGENSNLLSMEILVNWGTGVYNQRFNTVEKKTIEEITLQYTTRVLQGQPRHLDAAESAGILKFKELLDRVDNKVDLIKLTFSGEGYALYSAKLDDSEKLHSDEISPKAHWTKESGTEYDLVLPQNSQLKIYPFFLVDSGIATSLLHVIVNVSFHAKYSETSLINIPIQGYLEKMGEYWQLSPEGPLIVDIPVGVNFYDALIIEWKVIDETGVVIADNLVSKGRLYATYQVPFLAYPYDNSPYILYYSCTKAKEKSNKLEVINDLWEPFAKRHLTLEDFDTGTRDQFLSYYITPDNGQRTCYIASGHGITDGECTGFADLLVKIFDSQGINADTWRIELTNPVERFLVNNWNFGKNQQAENTEYPYKNIPKFINPDQNSYPRMRNRTASEGNYLWASKPDVEELPGIPGQGNPNPYSDFDTHTVVKLIGEETIFDPSYGTKFDNSKVMEEASIAGFGVEVETEYNEKLAGIDINGDGKKVEDLKWIKFIIRKNSNKDDIVHSK